jgi:hypothetical protein
MVFAFGTEDMVLTAIGEDENLQEVSEDQVKESKACDDLAAAAEKELKDLVAFSGVNTGTQRK